MAILIKPVRGDVYPLRVVLHNLDLRDCPALMVDHSGKRSPIQYAHVYYDVLLSDEEFAQSEWRYIQTTEEWVPVFHNVTDVERFLCIEPDKHSEHQMWITPKSCPHDQDTY